MGAQNTHNVQIQNTNVHGTNNDVGATGDFSIVNVSVQLSLLGVILILCAVTLGIVLALFCRRIKRRVKKTVPKPLLPKTNPFL